MNGNTRSILMVIAVILVAILGVLVYQNNQPKTPGEKIEAGLHDAADGVGDAVQNVGNDLKNAGRHQ